jgi:hypothetical protein
VGLKGSPDKTRSSLRWRSPSSFFTPSSSPVLGTLTYPAASLDLGRSASNAAQSTATRSPSPSFCVSKLFDTGKVSRSLTGSARSTAAGDAHRACMNDLLGSTPGEDEPLTTFAIESQSPPNQLPAAAPPTNAGVRPRIFANPSRICPPGAKLLPYGHPPPKKKPPRIFRLC